MKFSVIGAGVIGRLRAQTVTERPGLELVSVADPDQAAAGAAAGSSGAQVFADYREALAKTAPEAVIVAAPVHMHEEMVLASLAAGAHVLVEKPITNSVASARRVLEAAAERRRTLAVGFNHRFYPSMHYVKEVVESGRIGRLDHMRVFGGHDGLSNFRADWMYKSEYMGGGAMLDVGIHMTDLARFVGGEIATVVGIATGNVWKVPGSEDNAVALFETVAGVPIAYHATWDEWKGYGCFIEAYCERGMVRGFYAPMQNLLIERDPATGRRTKSRKLYPEVAIREKLRGWQTTTKLSFVRELAEFLDMLQGKKVELADGFSGLRALEIAEAVKRSRTERRVIELAPRDPRW